jgi:hypothetical protein
MFVDVPGKASAAQEDMLEARYGSEAQTLQSRAGVKL